MRHQCKINHLSRKTAHRKAMIANMASSLVKHGRIQTTLAKAKVLRPFVERLVTFAVRGDLHARRIVLARIRDTEAVAKLFGEYGPRYASRPGGYTRILKVGFRAGDNAHMALIEFVTEEKAAKQATRSKSSKAKTAKPAAKEADTTAKKAAPIADDSVAEEKEEAKAPVKKPVSKKAAPVADDSVAEEKEETKAPVKKKAAKKAPADEKPATGESAADTEKE